MSRVKPRPRRAAEAIPPAATGIPGFDEITHGGLPHGRTSLVVGGPGCGKTIFAMQFLVQGVKLGEPGIFVAFEETAERLVANMHGFGWDISALVPKDICVVDAQPSPDLIQSGTFDLDGMLAVLESQARRMGTKRIVFDAIDIILVLLPDDASRRREVYRLHAWLAERGLTAVITAKAAGTEAHQAEPVQPFGFMQFMVDCVVLLNHSVVLGVSQRNLRIQKYRGSSFHENESPFVIGSKGFDVAISRMLGRVDAAVTTERVSSGVARLDTMLDGGYYRGAAILITGFPGTAKTTMSGAFAEAACRRGERTLFVSFDSDGAEIVRNLASVGLRLAPHVKGGLLKMVSARTITGSSETLLVRIKALAEAHHARCVVVDPASAIAETGNELTAHGVAERLIDWTKASGITLLCTSLLHDLNGPDLGSKLLHISTLADVWIHLNYLMQAGERNRGMSIIKARGTAHSNQVREVILTNEGVTLADIYTERGEVLMGTMRWEKERSQREAAESAEVSSKLKRVRLDAEEAELQVRAKSLNTELVAKQVERDLLAHTTVSHAEESSRRHTRIRELRGADVAKRTRKKRVP